jgi:hypothetical protein
MKWENFGAFLSWLLRWEIFLTGFFLSKFRCIKYYECVYLYSCLGYPACKLHLLCIALLSSVTCLAAPYFSTFSHKGMIFRGKMLLNIKCVFLFSVQLLSETFLIVRRIHQNVVMNVHRSSCKVAIILLRFQWNFNFLDRFLKNIQISEYENPFSGSELFNVAGQTWWS